MEHKLSVLALALSGVVAVSAGAYATQIDPPTVYEKIAAVIGPMGIAAPDGQRDVIEPPSSIDPGMALDPPQTGAKMPIVHPPGTAPNGKLVLPH